MLFVFYCHRGGFYLELDLSSPPRFGFRTPRYVHGQLEMTRPPDGGPPTYRAHLWIRSYPQRGLYLFFLTEGKLRRRK